MRFGKPPWSRSPCIRTYHCVYKSGLCEFILFIVYYPVSSVRGTRRGARRLDKAATLARSCRQDDRVLYPITPNRSTASRSMV